MRNGIRTAIVLILLLAPALCLAGIFTPTGKITVKAVDRYGQAIPDAYARVTFYTHTTICKEKRKNPSTTGHSQRAITMPTTPTAQKRPSPVPTAMPSITPTTKTTG